MHRPSNFYLQKLSARYLRYDSRCWSFYRIHFLI